LCLPQDPDLLVEVVDLLILLVSEGTKVRIIYINYFDGDDLLAGSLTADLMLELKLQEERDSPFVHSTKRALANEFIECVSWSSRTRSLTFLDDCRFLAFGHADSFTTMFGHSHC